MGTRVLNTAPSCQLAWRASGKFVPKVCREFTQARCAVLLTTSLPALLAGAPGAEHAVIKSAKGRLQSAAGEGQRKLLRGLERGGV